MKKAFTILEILVVIAVLAILIGIAIPRFKSMKDNGGLAQVKAELKTIRAALESYRTFDPSKVYPPSTTRLTAQYLSGSNPKVVGVLYDPFGGTTTTEYNYLSSANGQYYVIWSVGSAGESQPTSVSDSGDIVF